MLKHCLSKKFNYIVHSSLEKAENDWNSILPEDHELRSENLKVLEIAKPDKLKFKYLVLKKDKHVTGVIYLQHFTLKKKYFENTILSKSSLKWFEKCLNSHFEDLLVCGNLFRSHLPGYFFTPETDESQLFEILLDYADNNSEKIDFCGIIIKDCLKSLKNHRSFRSYKKDIIMEMDLDQSWMSIEDYSRALTKKYKQRYKKIRKDLSPITVNGLSLDEILQYQDKIETLYFNVTSQQSLLIGTVNGAYFAEMKKKYGNNFVIDGYFHGSELIAFSSYIFRENNLLEMHFIGLDYSYNQEHSIYFNILFNGLETAIKSGVKNIELGRTAHLAKASLGAKPKYVQNYLYLKRGIASLSFNFFNNWYLKSIGNEWQTRNPLA
ncbi:MAG: hypothetical protein H6605_02575 [Flavobacteriales bacterium]|nr:hypothetical protein [Flavobacteriales bacterium]